MKDFLISMLITAGIYMLVPIIVAIVGKKHKLTTLRTVVFVNGIVCFCIFNIIRICNNQDISTNLSPAVIWSLFAYVILKKRCKISSEAVKDCETQVEIKKGGLSNTNNGNEKFQELCLSPLDREQEKAKGGHHIYGSDISLGIGSSDSQPTLFRLEPPIHMNAETKHSPNKQRYCSQCGCVIDNKTKKCTGCGKQYFKFQFKPLYIVLGMIILLVGYVGINYNCAVSAMNDQEFIRSKQYFDNLLLSEIIFSEKYEYVEAGVLLEEGKYIESFYAFNKLDDIPVSSTIIDDLKSKIYSAGREAYRSGNITEAEKNFSVIGNYRRSSDYLFLIKCKGDDLASWRYTINNYDKLIRLLDLEDAGEIILNNDSTIEMFLEGRWEDGTDDPYYFELREESDEEWYSYYNLPYKDVDGYFYLSNAIFSVGKTESTAVKIYKFSIVNEDIIFVYCYKDGSTHKLYRQ